MTEKQVAKSFLQKTKELILTVKKQNLLIFWSLVVSLPVFFIPLINLLLPIYWGGNSL